MTASAPAPHPARQPAPALASAALNTAANETAAHRGEIAASGVASASALADFDFHRPAGLAEAVRLLADHPEAVPLAGGTDLMVAVNYRLTRPAAMLDLTGLAELREWTDEGDAIRIGSGVPYARIVAELATVLPALAAASRTVGSPQIRNRGTLGGNLATASPAGDGHPPLLATGATVEIASALPRSDRNNGTAGSAPAPIDGPADQTASTIGDSADQIASTTGGSANLTTPRISGSANLGGSPTVGSGHTASSPIADAANPGGSPVHASDHTASLPTFGSANPGASTADGSAGFASVHLRTVPIAEFFLGPKRSALLPGELITAITVPKAAGPQQFLKVGTRNAMVIAVCSLAVALDLDTRRLGTGIGSAGPTPLTASEADRIELPWSRPALFNDALAEEFGRRVAAAARPIDDVRGTADYRRHALAICAARALRRVWTAAHREGTL